MSMALRNPLKRIYCIINQRCRQYSKETVPVDRNKPVKFTTSDAASWRAEFSRRGNIYDDSPDAQPFIVSLSTGIFLLYFLWYREESDIDDKFNIFEDNLYTKVEGLEEVQLKLARTVKLERGEDVRALDARIKVLEEERLRNEQLQREAHDKERLGKKQW